MTFETIWPAVAWINSRMAAGNSLDATVRKQGGGHA